MLSTIVFGNSVFIPIALDTTIIETNYIFA